LNRGSVLHKNPTLCEALYTEVISYTPWLLYPCYPSWVSPRTSLVMIRGLCTKIWTQHIPNTKQEFYPLNIKCSQEQSSRIRKNAKLLTSLCYQQCHNALKRLTSSNFCQCSGMRLGFFTQQNKANSSIFNIHTWTHTVLSTIWTVTVRLCICISASHEISDNWKWPWQLQFQ
jgi:hypothetical protein